MRYSLPGVLILLLLGLPACSDAPLVEPDPVDDAPEIFFEVQAGSLQHGKIGTELPKALVARVLDDKGKELSDYLVNPPQSSV